MRAYGTTLGLLEEAITRSTSLEKQYSQLSNHSTLKQTKGLAVDAASLAIDGGEVELALELLEQGRAVLFAQLGRYRTALDDIAAVAPELAKKLVTLGRQLDAVTVSGEWVTSGFEPRSRFEDDMTRYGSPIYCELIIHFNSLIINLTDIAD